MKISIDAATELFQGLQALDGYEKATPEGKVVREFYKLGGLTRLAAARNMNALKPVLKAFSDARDDLIRQMANGGSRLEAGSAEAMTFAEQERAMRAAEQDVDLATITEADLALDANPIPASVLAALAPILKP